MVKIISTVLIVAGICAVALKDTLGIANLAKGGYALIGAGLFLIASGFFGPEPPKKKD